MAHFSESLCEEVIKTEGKCGLTRNEMVQMARFALRAIKNENPLLVDAIRYRWLRDMHGVVSDPDGTHTYYLMSRHEPLDAAIDAAMASESSPSAALPPTKE